MEKTTVDTHSRLSGSCKFCSFKLSLNLSLTNFRAQINFNEIFHDSLKTSKFARICVENRGGPWLGGRAISYFPHTNHSNLGWWAKYSLRRPFKLLLIFCYDSWCTKIEFEVAIEHFATKTLMGMITQSKTAELLREKTQIYTVCSLIKLWSCPPSYDPLSVISESPAQDQTIHHS